MKNKCEVKNRKRVLFWEWEEIETNHVYRYSADKKMRKCKKCGIKEMFWGEKMYPSGQGIWEDWRLLMK